MCLGCWTSRDEHSPEDAVLGELKAWGYQQRQAGCRSSWPALLQAVRWEGTAVPSDKIKKKNLCTLSALK